MHATQMFEQNPNEYEQPDHELLAGSLDLLAGIIEGLHDLTAQVLVQQNFLVVIPEVLKCKAHRVKQSGFALMGSAATHVIDELGPLLPQLLPLCATGLSPGMTTMVRLSKIGDFRMVDFHISKIQNRHFLDYAEINHIWTRLGVAAPARAQLPYLYRRAQPRAWDL